VVLAILLGRRDRAQINGRLRPTGAAVSSADAAPIFAVPPVVIKTVPESGAAGVDPSLPELRVTFSKPMQDGDWSWCGIEDEDVPSGSTARYLADQRTCVLPVKLQPGKVYVIWLNSSKFQNFQDRSGHPAVPYLLIFETRK
jgi:RNA polymerase sigma-70 factor (ECF subfamily)